MKPNKMNLTKQIQRMYMDFWLINPNLHKTLCEKMFQVSGMQGFMIEESAELKPDISDSTAIIPIKGVIGKDLMEIEKMMGMVDVNDIGEMVDWAMEDESIKSVLFDIDSPGGTVNGIPELADKVMALNENKKCISYTSGLMCSAAYWIGSQSYAVMASKSAQVGSVGVYLPFMDMSRMAEMQGIKVDVIKAGKFKGAGVQGTALNDDQRSMLQDRVNYIHANFKEDIKRVRDVEDSDMEGQDFFAPLALGAGLIDEVCDYNGALRDAKMLAK